MKLFAYIEHIPAYKKLNNFEGRPREGTREDPPKKKSSSGVQRIHSAYIDSSSGVQIGYTRHMSSSTPAEVFCTPAELEPASFRVQS